MPRIASYNIYHGGLVDMHMDVLGADIAEVGADIVGVQEVDQFAARSGSVDTVRLLSESSGLPYYAFARSIPFQGGEYGTAILSRYPILSFTVTPLASGTSEPRTVGYAVLDVDGQRVHFFNTHLTLVSDELRAEELSQISAMFPADEPWILTGDFNTENFALFEPLGGTVLNCAENRMPSFYPRPSAIDNIICSRDWSHGDFGMRENRHSDHYMIWWDLAAGKEGKGTV